MLFRVSFKPYQGTKDFSLVLLLLESSTCLLEGLGKILTEELMGANFVLKRACS